VIGNSEGEKNTNNLHAVSNVCTGLTQRGFFMHIDIKSADNEIKIIKIVQKR